MTPHRTTPMPSAILQHNSQPIPCLSFHVTAHIVYTKLHSDTLSYLQYHLPQKAHNSNETRKKSMYSQQDIVWVQHRHIERKKHRPQFKNLYSN